MNMGRSVRYLFAFALLGPVGCNLLPINLGGQEKTDKVGHRLGHNREPQPAAPAKYQVRVAPFLFLSDTDLKGERELFSELSRLREQVCRELKLPDSQTVVQVHIFEDRDHYEQYMRTKYPELPKRRAFFIQQPRSVGGGDDLLVFTYRGERIREDLRHELTHALLHSVLKGVPLWLDEGLAEYFEVPGECQGVNFAHLDQIRRGEHGLFRPELARLEQISQVQHMSPTEYREAWAWVHLMLRGRPDGKAVLVRYLQQLRTTENPGPLAPALAKVYPSPEDVLVRHVALLDGAPRPAPRASR
jgi:hypothetical protein